MAVTALNGWDVFAVIAYFALVIGVSVYSMYVSKRGSINGYFLAGRFITFIPVGASLFASNIGSEHFIGLAGSGAAAGIGVGSFELNAIILLQMLGLLFIPVYIASNVCTLPEYMEKRFGGGKRIRVYLSILSLVLYIFTKISVNLYSGALFIKHAIGWNLYTAVVLLLVLTAATTITGGLTAVIYTDTLQAFIMIVGAGIVAVKGFIEVGGVGGLQEKYMAAIPDQIYENTTCGYPREDSFVMLRNAKDSDLPWPGFILGQTPASIWYWCADQIMVQRVLASKSISHAQGATIFAGYLKILPIFMMVIPGMISRALYPNTVGCATETACMAFCQNKVGCSNLAYPELVLNLMPTGLKGVMIAVMLAALMSDLTSIFNSASTLFTMDIWPLFRKKAKTKELLLVGRGFVLVMTVVSILWIPLLEVLQGGQLYIYIQAIAAYLSPPIASVYLLAVLSTRINEKGAFFGLVIGTLIGIIRMITEFSYKEPRCGEVDSRPGLVTLHYMYFAMITFWVTCIVSIVISYFTEQPKPELLNQTTIWTLNKDNKPSSVHQNSSIDEEDKIEMEIVEEPAQASEEETKIIDHDVPIYIKAFNWVCGFNEIVEQTKIPPKDLINSLAQSKKMKFTVWANSGVIITIGFIMFIVFTFGFKP